MWQQPGGWLGGWLINQTPSLWNSTDDCDVYFLEPSSRLMISRSLSLRFSSWRKLRLLRASFTLRRRASAWSLNITTTQMTGNTLANFSNTPLHTLHSMQKSWPLATTLYYYMQNITVCTHHPVQEIDYTQDTKSIYRTHVLALTCTKIFNGKSICKSEIGKIGTHQKIGESDACTVRFRFMCEVTYAFTTVRLTANISPPQ